MNLSTIKNKTIIIAEAGVNHNGSLQRALDMVDVAAEAGADIIKFQTFKASEVISACAPKAQYQIAATGNSESQLEMALKLELDDQSHFILKRRCQEKNIEFLSSPFDDYSLNFLIHDLGVQRIKIGSGEITNFPFLLAVARAGRDIILSTGMSTLGEIEVALGVIAYGYICDDKETKASLDVFRAAFSSQEGQFALRECVSLLHCTTEYPSNIADANLNAILTMKMAFGLPVGLSDHTLGIEVPIAAVAKGAEIIEKHFTLDKDLKGPDHLASLSPIELKDMVSSIRNVELALGDGIKYPSHAEKNNLPIVRRSLTAACAISKGEVFTQKNLTVKRPGTGISAIYYWDYLGNVATRSYEKDGQIESS